MSLKKIGYYLSKSKASKLDWDDFIKLVKEEEGIIVTPITLDETLEQQGPFDVIVHKVTDEIADKNNQALQQKIKYLGEYVARHPEVIEIDPLARQIPLVDRGIMSRLLHKLNTDLPSELNVLCPQYLVVEQKQANYNQLLSQANIKFPVVCKTIQACGSRAAHEMGIVFTEGDLHSFEAPFMVQEYVNHDATLFKVFVIGEFIDVVRRGSLRNVAPTETKPLLFDSQKPLPEYLTQSTTIKTPDVPANVIKAMAEHIRKQLGLSLFGFDVITNSATHKHACIDVNYFPGYVGVPDVFHVFLNHFKKSFQNKTSTY